MAIRLSPEAQVLSVPGWHSSPPGHWQTLWEEQAGGRVARVEQEDWENADRDRWVLGLENVLEQLNLPVVLLAHSLGALTVVHWAAQSMRTGQVAGAFLVAPPDVECCVRCPGCLQSFSPIPRELLPFPTLVVGSENDPYAAAERVAGMASDWGARFVSAGNAGHINLASGHGCWPEGERWFESFLDEAVHLWEQKSTTAAGYLPRTS